MKSLLFLKKEFKKRKIRLSHCQESLADLNDYYNHQISRKWEQVQQDIEKLKELESSFSEPKKHELIDQIKKLAESPLGDASEQAHRVRMLRSNWQSLGFIATSDEEIEQEKALSETFNQFCEQAFAPCRDHYKQLEDERNSHYEAKLLLINQLETLDQNLKQAEVQNWREVEALFNKLTKLWRDTGLVDREKVNEVNGRYQKATKSIKNAISNYHNDNQDRKAQLIEQAKQIVEQDLDVNAKSDQLKALQNEWRKVGFAGRNIDQKLWNEFRAVNNPVFEQRDSDKKQAFEAAEVEYEQFVKVFSELQSSLENAQELTDVRTVVEQTMSVLNDVKNLPRNLLDKLKKQQQSIIKFADERTSLLRKMKEQQVYVDLFNAVEAIASGNAANLSTLKASWQSAINTNGKDDRQHLTLMLEINAGIVSPEQDKSQRNQVQMEMMSAKLEQGIEYEQPDLLESWLAAGIFAESDIELLNRIKPIFLS